MLTTVCVGKARILVADNLKASISNAPSAHSLRIACRQAPTSHVSSVKNAAQTGTSSKAASSGSHDPIAPALITDTRNSSTTTTTSVR